MTAWRSAWHSPRKTAGLPNVRFHDGRSLEGLTAAGVSLDVPSVNRFLSFRMRRP